MSPRPLLLLALLCAPPVARAAAPELAPYAAYVRSGAGQRLLALTRESLCMAAGRCDSAFAQAPDWPGTPRPVFVTLVRSGATRACLGRDEPLGTLGETVRSVALELLAGDRRRDPVRAEELDSLDVCVAFAGDALMVSDPFVVNPRREGLRIETERGAVAFLPGEARTVHWALSEARRIGVLRALADARFSRFDVVVLSGPAATRTATGASQPDSREVQP